MRVRSELWKGVDRICWLCVLMERFAGSDSLEHAPVLLSGMDSVLGPGALSRARQAVFNFRQLSLSYVTTHFIKHAVTLYNDHHARNHLEGPFRIDAETLRFSRTDAFETDEIREAVAYLSSPLPYDPHGSRMADPDQEMVVQVGRDANAVRIPIGPLQVRLPPRRLHDLNRRPRGRIEVPLAELAALAREMDERDREAVERRPGNWEDRLRRVTLLVPDPGVGLKEDAVLTLEGLRHLIGLPGAGKTTLLVLLGVWLSRRGYRMLMLFPSIEVARQYQAELAFHEVNVGMLVGQNPVTRRGHAERIAEAIAAQGGQGGFGQTIQGADNFGANCVLPAFASGDASAWGFGEAPCSEILQDGGKGSRRMQKRLCPVWTACGRNKAPREVVDADVWVGHVLSMDTDVPRQAVEARIRYFELIARTFDVVIFDEADMVQTTLDDYGTALLNISGADDSVHRVIQDQIHRRFARGENHRLSDRVVQFFSRDLAEFGMHNDAMINAAQTVSARVGDRFADKLLTTARMITELLEGFDGRPSPRDERDDAEVVQMFAVRRALTELWDHAAYTAFYDRTGDEITDWPKSDLCARTLGMDPERLNDVRTRLIALFRRYLAANLATPQREILDEIVGTFLKVCFPDRQPPMEARDAVVVLVSITFMILGYQRIVPGTRNMVAEGLIRDPVVKGALSPALRKVLPENIIGSLSGVKYSYSRARSTRGGARNVTLSYVSFVGASRMLMHRFHRLLDADGGVPGPAVLMTSATSFLEASPAYHVDAGPHYVLKPRTPAHDTSRSTYRFKWIPDRQKYDAPLRYSGAGDLAARNLEQMVDALARGGMEKSEIYKSIRNFDVRDGIPRKAALVVNGYEQARAIKRFLDENHREVGRRTKAVVRSLEAGETPAGYVTSAQAEALGDDDTCDIVVFPLSAIGRGVNIVFTKGPRVRQAAIGSIYFLTRPHPSAEDTQLLNSLAGRATQVFDARRFANEADLPAVSEAWQQARRETYRLARRLLQEPIMASRLGAELFRPFTANQMVAILQTIGRGMRDGCPVAVYFVDAAWAARSTRGEPDSPRDSMLVQMRGILEECVTHQDPVKREIYRELYTPFLDALRRTEGIVFPASMRTQPDALYVDDGFDDSHPLMEM